MIDTVAMRRLVEDDPFPALLGDGAAWRRCYGRVGRKGYATLLYERSGERPDIRAIFLGSGVSEASGIGRYSMARWSDDGALPALAELACGRAEIRPIRYRPGKRCTLLLPRGDGLFLKALADDRGAQIVRAARQLWHASRSAEFDFDVARPAGWLSRHRVIAHHRIAGWGVAEALRSATGPALALRMGRANASLARSALKPEVRYDYAWQMARTAKYARRMSGVLPAAEPLLGRIMARLSEVTPVSAHRPIHGAPHLHQWLAHEDHLALVDFDRFGLGDPELDAATFLAEADFEDRFDGVGDAYVAGFDRAWPLDHRLVEAYRLHKHLAKAERLLGAIRMDGAERSLDLLRRTARAGGGDGMRRLLFYCQHSLGLGHFVRSLALAEALAEHFEVTFFNGGPMPRAIDLPERIRFVHLPPLRMEEDGSLSGAGRVEDIFAKRSAIMREVAAEASTAALVIELYPFGRKKFAIEIEPLIEQVRAMGGKVACSVRDILVTDRVDQARHDQRAADTLARAFDMVLVHSDPRLSRLGDSFRPARPAPVPVHHTGFVLRTTDRVAGGGSATFVTAGGGIVGLPLYLAALDAQPRLWAAKRWPMLILGGPLLPEDDWHTLSRCAQGVPGVTLMRAAPSIAPMLAGSGRVVSQCGYNSALEFLAARIPTLFVPFARGQETEQTTRARQFAELGLSRWLPAAGLTGAALAEALLQPAPQVTDLPLDTGGAVASARIVAELAA